MAYPIFPTTKKAAEKAGETYSSQENRNAQFPTRLRELREKSKVSQKALADKLGISKSTIGLWETGDTLPDAKSLYDLAEYFGVSTDYLLCRTETISTDLDIRRVCDYTGISEDTIKSLVSQHKRLDSSYMEAFNEFFTPTCMQEILAYLWRIRKSVNSLKETIASIDDTAEGKEEFPIYKNDPYQNLLTKSIGIGSMIKELRLERFETAEYLSATLDSAFGISETIEDAREAIGTCCEYIATLSKLEEDDDRRDKNATKK